LIGVLALQGSFIEHLAALKSLHEPAKEVRSIEDIRDVIGLIMPGGESTAIMKLLVRSGLDKEIIRRYRAGRFCIWGTCAGAIVLAKKIRNYPRQPSLKLLDIEIDRNGYGRQAESFTAKLTIGKRNSIGVFIRAPIIASYGTGVTVVAEYEGKPVMVRQDQMLATTFHPELGADLLIHKYFVRMCAKLA